MIGCYIILANDSTYYTGISKHVVKRYQEHKSHKSAYFKYRSVVELVWVRYFDDCKKARSCEKWIKSIGAKKFMCKFP